MDAAMQAKEAAAFEADEVAERGAEDLDAANEAATLEEEIFQPEGNLPVEESAERGIIKEKNTTKGIGIQYFANKGILKQNDKQLQKSIGSWRANIEKHKDKVNNPAKYDKDWDFKDERQKAGLVKHWEKEIRYSEENIKEAEAELAKRGKKNGDG